MADGSLMVLPEGFLEMVGYSSCPLKGRECNFPQKDDHFQEKVVWKLLREKNQIIGSGQNNKRREITRV